MSTTRRALTITGGALTVALCGGAVAWAAFSPVDGSGAISGCYSQKNGALRVVAPGSRCGNGEAPLVWQQAGQPGPAGPAGPAGALSCADELRILAAAPVFVVSPSCAPTPAPTSSATPVLAGVEAPASLTVGASAVGYVHLSAPAPEDTTVQVTATDSGIGTVTNATVAAGMTTGSYTAWGVQAGTTQITATLGTVSKTATLQVLPPG